MDLAALCRHGSQCSLSNTASSTMPKHKFMLMHVYVLALLFCLLFPFPLPPKPRMSDFFWVLQNPLIIMKLTRKALIFICLLNRSPGKWDSDLEFDQVSTCRAGPARLLVPLKLSSLYPTLSPLSLILKDFFDLIRLPLSLSLVGAVRWVSCKTHNSYAYKGPPLNLRAFTKKKSGILRS